MAWVVMVAGELEGELIRFSPGLGKGQEGEEAFQNNTPFLA